MKNELSVPTTIHWHGVEVPNAMDGVPDVTQKAIQTGETFVYEFTAKPAETFMYHPHYEGDVQVMAGLYAPFIIDPKIPEINPPAVDKTLMISEWLLRGGQTYAAMPMSGMEPNYFTINGKSLPYHRSDYCQERRADSSMPYCIRTVYPPHSSAWHAVQDCCHRRTPHP